MKLIFNFKSLCSTTVVSLIAVTSVSGCLPHGTAGMSKSKSFNGSTENVGIRFDLSKSPENPIVFTYFYAPETTGFVASDLEVQLVDVTSTAVTMPASGINELVLQPILFSAKFIAKSPDSSMECLPPNLKLNELKQQECTVTPAVQTQPQGPKTFKLPELSDSDKPVWEKLQNACITKTGDVRLQYGKAPDELVGCYCENVDKQILFKSDMTPVDLETECNGHLDPNPLLTFKGSLVAACTEAKGIVDANNKECACQTDDITSFEPFKQSSTAVEDFKKKISACEQPTLPTPAPTPAPAPLP